MAAAPDLTIICSGDAVDWNKYLSECFAQVTDPEPINIRHERLDLLTFPLSTDQSQVLTSSKCVLVIISPEFLDFVDEHADVFELGKLLRPYQTISILCGVQEHDVTRFQKAALVSYDSWPRLVARDQDENFVLSVIRVTKEVLTRMEDVHTSQKPSFQLSPRKVKEGNNKVFIMMKKPVNEKQKVQVFLDVEGCREVPVKKRNIFTFQFVVPENFLRYSRMINVHVRCDDAFFGVRQIKVESRLGELYSNLSSVNSPYELLCDTLGVAAYHEVDEILTKNFVQNSPEGISLLAGELCVDKKKSVEELPTLLHFAARYGLPKLMKAILQYPMAMPASRMRNVRGLTPFQLAHSSGHNDIVLLLEEFEKTLESVKMSCRLPDTSTLPRKTSQPVKPNSPTNYENVSFSNETYNTPLNIVVPLCQNQASLDPKSPDYLPMTGPKVLYADKLEPHELVILGLDDRPPDFENNFHCRLTDSFDLEERDNTMSDIPPSRNYPSGLCTSQRELLEILENYKKGTPMMDIENQFQTWQNKYKNSANQNTLSSLREAYKMIQKQQKHNKKQAFSLCELKQALFKMGKKAPHSSSTPTINSEKVSKERAHSLGEVFATCTDGFRPVSTLSTASSASSSSSSSFDRCSAVSAGSACDSGNHSDSCDETSRAKENKEKSQTARSNLASKLSISLRPPAPPPRPPKFMPRTAKRDKPKMEILPIEPHNYYNQGEIRECSPDYVAPDTDLYIFASEREQTVVTVSDCSRTNNTNGQAEQRIPFALKRTCKNVSDSGEDIYYDIPAPPLPIRSENKSAAQDPYRDYHIPKIPAQRTSQQTSASHYYAIPKSTPGTPPRPQVPRPTLSTINISLEVPCQSQGNSPTDDRCNSIPSEPPPPPPIESEYDLVPLPRKFKPTGTR